MRKWTILILVLLVGTVYAIDQVYTTNRAGTVVEPGQLHTAQNVWVVIDTALLEAGAEPNDLAVTERTYVTVNAATEGGDDKILVYDIPASWNYVRLRCIGKTDGTSVVFSIYLGTRETGTDCELAYAGQLTFTIGTQASTTSDYELADTVTVVDGEWIPAWSISSPIGNRVAEVRIDLDGSDTLVAVPTTIGSDCKLLGKGR